MKKLMIIMVFVLAAAPAMAEYAWTNSQGDNDFLNYANWSPDDATGFTSTSDVRVDMGGTDKAVLDSFTEIGYVHVGYWGNTTGLLEIQAGAEIIAGNNFYLAYGSGTNGTINMTGGSVTATASYTTLGGQGQALLNISGGNFLANRMTLGSSAGSTGAIALSGTGRLQVQGNVSGSAGALDIRMEGAGASLIIGNGLYAQGGATSNRFEFVLDGAAGVGAGITVNNYMRLPNGTVIDLSFMDSAVDGTYTIMTATTIDDQSVSGLLSAESVAAGWSYEVVNTASGQILNVTIPEPATISMLVFGGLGLFARRKRSL